MWMEEFLEDKHNSTGWVTYAICGLEIGESGTPHMQGFVHCGIPPKDGGLQFWRAHLKMPNINKAHFENAKGTDEQNQKYCSKEGVYMEWGEPTENQSIFKKIMDTAKVSIEEAMEIDPEAGLKYVNQIVTIWNMFNTNGSIMNKTLPELRPWQKRALEKLENQSSRQILFVVDIEGGKGKSVLAKHIMSSKDAWGCQGKFG